MASKTTSTSSTSYHPQPAPRVGKKALSLLAQFDDLVRNANTLSAGGEEEMVNILRAQENARKLWLALSEDHNNCDSRVKKLNSERTALETQLKHARLQINIEMERRVAAEKARTSLERQIGLVRELLVDKKNNSIMTDFDRERLAPVLTSTTSLKALEEQTVRQADQLKLHTGQGGAPPTRTTPKGRLDVVNESSNSILDDDISYDRTEDDSFFNSSALNGNESAARKSGGKRRSSRGRRSGKRPSAPMLDDIENENPIPDKRPTKALQGYEIETADRPPPQPPRQNLNSAAIRKRDEDLESVDSFWGVGGSVSTLIGGVGGNTIVGGGTTSLTATAETPAGKPLISDRTPGSGKPTLSDRTPGTRKTPSNGISPGFAPGMTPGRAGATPGRGGLARPHAFVQKTIVRMETCIPCGKRITFGKIAYKCRDCRSICHPECRDLVPVPCISVQSATPRGAAPGVLADYAPLEAPMIPALIVHCAQQVEARGLNEQGIYRVPGSDSMVRDLTEKFERGKGVPNLSRIDDIHVVCSCLKQFLRKLREPVTTYGLWGSFVRAAEIFKTGDVEHAVTMVHHTIAQLPQPNRDTLSFLILHLMRVSQSPATKMPVHNLAKVFGPTIVGYSSPEPEAMQMLNEPKKQADVLELLMLGVEVGFWEATMKPAEEALAPTTPDTPDLTQRLGNRIGTLTTPEGDAGLHVQRTAAGNTGSINRLFARGGKIGSNKKSKTSTNFYASPNLK